MTLLTDLKSEGWHLSNEGFDLCLENVDRPSVSSIIKRALDMDLREIGGNFLPEDLTKGKIDCICGPGVVQIQKIKNASAPKYEYGTGAPPILRLLLTDGNNYINCLQWGQWKSISMDTPPGTKLLLKPTKMAMQSHFLLLSEHQFNVLGGCVAAMVEKWELCRKLASHIRTKENLDGTGPPPWIPFGQQIVGVKQVKSGSNFRSLESEQKDAKEDAVFKQQRQANIAEVSRVKETKAKSFGGRKDKPLGTKPDNVNTSYVQLHDYSSYDNDNSRRVADPAQDSPMKNRQPYNNNNERNRRGGTRNDYAQARQDNARTSNSAFVGSLKDNKNKLGDFIPHIDIRQHSSAFQAKPPLDPEPPKQHNKSFNHNKGPFDKKRNLVNLMDQVKIYGYDDRNNFIATEPFLKPGVEVMAKYWEDNQYYRAVVHAVGQEGKTCVVHFLDYGNYEEVLIADVQERTTPSSRDRNWSAGPISFQPSSRNNYEAPHNQNYRDASKPHQNSNRLYGRQDATTRQLSNRTEYRPSAKIYQPPSRRDS